MSAVQWTENTVARTSGWLADTAAPSRIVPADDRLTARAALRHARQGTALLWRGDFVNARTLIRDMDRRLPANADTFAALRTQRAERARLLGAVLVELGPDYTVALRRAPDVRAACTHAFGPPASALVPLRTLLGALSAYEWHRKGILVPEAGGRIHPAYGVFAPTRREYLDLVAQHPFPPGATAFDIGTGTGVLAAVLARRGARSVVATDSPAAPPPHWNKASTTKTRQCCTRFWTVWVTT